MRERVPLSIWDSSLMASGESVPDVQWEEFFRAGTVNGYNPYTGVPFRTMGEFLKDPSTLPHDRWMTTQLEEGAEPMFWMGLTLSLMIWAPLTALAKVTHTSLLTPLLVAGVLTAPMWLYFARGRRTEKRGEVGGSVLWIPNDTDDGAFAATLTKAMGAIGLVPKFTRVTPGGGWTAKFRPSSKVFFARDFQHGGCFLAVRTIGAANAAQHRRMKGVLLEALGLAATPAA